MNKKKKSSRALVAQRKTFAFYRNRGGQAGREPLKRYWDAGSNLISNMLFGMFRRKT